MHAVLAPKLCLTEFDQNHQEQTQFRAITILSFLSGASALTEVLYVPWQRCLQVIARTKFSRWPCRHLFDMTADVA
eukprot:scaffold156453_cov30-Prasinocladus_malaysianus.AAC.2